MTLSPLSAPVEAPVFPQENAQLPEHQALATKLEELLGESDYLEATGLQDEQVIITRNYSLGVTITVIEPLSLRETEITTNSENGILNRNIHNEKVTTFVVDPNGDCISYAKMVIAIEDKKGVLHTNIFEKNIPIKIDLASLLENMTINPESRQISKIKRFTRKALSILQNSTSQAYRLNN
jgi:hypothetical protein